MHNPYFESPILMGLEMVVILGVSISFLNFYFQHSLKCISGTPSWSGNLSATFHICCITNLQSCIHLSIHISRWFLFNCALGIKSFDCDLEALTATHRFLLHMLSMSRSSRWFLSWGKTLHKKYPVIMVLVHHCCQCVWRVKRNLWNTILCMHVHTNTDKRAFSQ
jgi:hypothetical protein